MIEDTVADSEVRHSDVTGVEGGQTSTGIHGQLERQVDVSLLLPLLKTKEVSLG